MLNRSSTPQKTRLSTMYEKQKDLVLSNASLAKMYVAEIKRVNSIVV
jgi:hypothetical protein